MRGTREQGVSCWAQEAYFFSSSPMWVTFFWLYWTSSLKRKPNALRLTSERPFGNGRSTMFDGLFRPDIFDC